MTALETPSEMRAPSDTKRRTERVSDSPLSRSNDQRELAR